MSAMNSQRWSQIEEIFHTALKCEITERQAYITRACGGDTQLQQEVESLIASYDRPGEFLESVQLSAGLTLFAALRSELQAGEIIGPYTILRRIGQGGMGDVYLARDERLGRQIALKLLPRSLCDDFDWITQFRVEARAASAISHPNIAHIYEVGEFEGRHFIAMEYVDGITLRELINNGPLTFEKAMDLMRQATEGMAAAHAVGVFHSDIKPENLMVRFDGYLKVLDFGLAKIEVRSRQAAEGSQEDLNENSLKVIRGTPRYMSPEQAVGGSADARNDVWSLGVVLYEMLCGEPPFTGNSAPEILERVRGSEPSRLAQSDRYLSPALKEILRRALHKNSGSRYQTMSALLEDLWKLMHDPTSNGHLVSQYAKKRSREAIFNRRVVFGVIIAVVLLVSGIGLAIKVLGTFYAPTLQAANQGMTKTILKGIKSGGVISPNGEYLAYGSVDAAGLWSTRLRDLRNDNDWQLLPPKVNGYGGLAFSRDSQTLYFTSTAVANANEFLQNALYTISVSGGPSKKLTIGVNSSPTFSPDGQRMAFIRRNSTLREASLITANLDGTDEKILASVKYPTVFYFPSWSPDGKLIAMGQRSLDAKGYYASAIAVHVDSGEIKTLTQYRWPELVAVQWLSDGKGILAMAVDREGEPMQVWEIGYPSGKHRNVTEDSNNYTYWALTTTADSSQMLLVKNTIVSNIWSTHGEQSDAATQISHGAGDGFNGIAWTPDNQILYTAQSPNDWDIWSMNPDGSERTRLTVNVGNNFYPAVSSDNRYIVFSSNRGGNFNIWRMERDGSNPTRLTHGIFDDFPSFTADGQWVIYRTTDFDSRKLLKVSVSGGEPIELLGKSSYPPAISPDGQFVAAFSTIGNLRGLAVIPSDGGEPIRTFDFLPSPTDSDNPFSQVIRWTRDGKSISYMDRQNEVSNIWSQQLTSNQRLQLTRFNSDQIFFFDWSTDGKQLVLCRGRIEQEAVLVKDFR